MENKTEELVRDVNQMEFLKQIQSTMESDWRFYSAFHIHNLKRVKSKLGSKCTYLSYVKEKGLYYIKAVMKVDEGKKTLTYSIGTDFKNVTEKNYDELFDVLNSGDYGQTKDISLLPES